MERCFFPSFLSWRLVKWPTGYIWLAAAAVFLSFFPLAPVWIRGSKVAATSEAEASTVIHGDVVVIRHMTKSFSRMSSRMARGFFFKYKLMYARVLSEKLDRQLGRSAAGYVLKFLYI